MLMDKMALKCVLALLIRPTTKESSSTKAKTHISNKTLKTGLMVQVVLRRDKPIMELQVTLEEANRDLQTKEEDGQVMIKTVDRDKLLDSHKLQKALQHETNHLNRMRANKRS